MFDLVEELECLRDEQVQRVWDADGLYAATVAYGELTRIYSALVAARKRRAEIRR